MLFMKDGLFKKFLSFSYGNWIGLIIGFVTTMVTTRILLPGDFGKASMFTLALNIIMIVIMVGTDQSFIRFFYDEKEDKRGELLYVCLKPPFYMVILISILLIIFRNPLAVFLFGEENPIAIWMLVIGIIAQLGDRYSRLVIRMKQKGGLYSFLEVLLKLLTFATLIGFYLMLGARYDIIIFSTVLSLFIVFFSAVYIERRFWSPKSLRVKNVSHNLKEIVHFGMPFMVTGLITWLFESFDKIAIRQWSTLDELGLYSAAFKIVALVHVFQITFQNFWTPVCYEHYQKKPEDREFYGRMMHAISMGMFTVAIASIAGKDVIIAFLGKNYAEAANIMPFLVFMPVLHTISETTVMGINFMKKPKWHIAIAAIACLANIGGNALLVPTYGAKGAAFATAVAYVVFFTLRTVISKRYYQVKYGLTQFYIVLLAIFAYAGFSIITESFWLNILGGVVALMFMLVVYKKETAQGYAYVRSMNLFRKKK